MIEGKNNLGSVTSFEFDSILRHKCIAQNEQAYMHGSHVF